MSDEKSQTSSTAVLTSPIPGPKILLIGDSGTGKTHTIRTLLDAGFKEVFVIFTEPGMEVVGDIPAGKLMWKYLAPARSSWKTLREQANKINTLPYKTLTEMADMDKRKYNQFVQLYDVLANFKDDRTGKEYGAVDEWGTDRALVIDSLSGINLMAMKLVVGGKPVKSQPDWQVAMDNVETLVTQLTTGAWATVVIMAHMEREVDEITGGSTIMVSSLGRKLAPKLPRFFSDCIQSVRSGKEFTWSTATSNAALKSRNLPIANNIQPSFVRVVETWKKRGGLIAPGVGSYDTTDYVDHDD